MTPWIPKGHGCREKWILLGRGQGWRMSLWFRTRREIGTDIYWMHYSRHFIHVIFSIMKLYNRDYIFILHMNKLRTTGFGNLFSATQLGRNWTLKVAICTPAGITPDRCGVVRILQEEDVFALSRISHFCLCFHFCWNTNYVLDYFRHKTASWNGRHFPRNSSG